MNLIEPSGLDAAIQADEVGARRAVGGGDRQPVVVGHRKANTLLLHRGSGPFGTALEVDCEDLRAVSPDLVVLSIQLDQLIAAGWSPMGSRENEHESGFTAIPLQAVLAPRHIDDLEIRGRIADPREPIPRAFARSFYITG